mgnify:CR=1 FL=1
MQKASISESVIRRLPRYYRFLSQLEEAGIERTSSRELGVQLGLTASQIRQDLNNFGGFGQQGYGYSVKYLYDEIGVILGLDKQYKIVIVGYGRLGQAMANYIKKNEGNFHISGIFDVKQQIRDVEFDDAQILTCANLSTFIEKEGVDFSQKDFHEKLLNLCTETT